ncbi:hypothetical protein BKA70DRAFT_1463926 [Coprinopsis sp. MPI-PUGE-AT-0042]|nr:hypothetical protein BKA70DRAFT_1463926 [Coprinopsis sp. MPI-PUGE-AT-0042]
MVGLAAVGRLEAARHSKASGLGLSLSRQTSRLSAREKTPDSVSQFTKINPPPHRHAAPSAPWPWIDIGDDISKEDLSNDAPPIPEFCAHINCTCWTGYPASRFPNWTEPQVRKSKIWDAREKHRDCTIYLCDVNNNGIFKDVGVMQADDGHEKEVWENILRDSRERPDNLRVRAMFVQNMSGPVLQMLGARFNIEPFFFSSSIGWIPSRFQEEIKRDEGDHITITLPFIKASHEGQFKSGHYQFPSTSTILGAQHIDTQSPLYLSRTKAYLALDLISVHLIRNIKGSTIISYHPDDKLPTTKADVLHKRICFAGQSVYWQSMFQKSPDPTLVLMCFTWHALYAWDEALESLYQHILHLETRVIETAHMKLTQELHVIRAHHLHYSSLLDEFIKNIEFIEETENPFMTVKNFSVDIVDENRILIKRECKTLKQEVKRLKADLHMQERRLKNVMNLVFSSVNIEDSKYMKKMTEAAVRDSAAMKQIAYLTMIFLPATFVAGVFGMNVTEINPEGTATLPHYIAVALPLTVFTAWVIVAFQSRYIFEEEAPFWHRLAWPFILLWRWMTGQPLTFPEKKEGVNLNDDADDPGVPLRELGGLETEDEDHKSDNNSITIAVVASSPTSDGGFPGRRSHSFSLSQSLSGSSRAH